MSTPTDTPTAWAHLPNAKHIDRVLADVRTHPQVWAAAYDVARAVAQAAGWTAAYDTAQGAAWGTARDAAWDAVHRAARGAARGATLAADQVAAQVTAQDICAALIAWDDSADLLGMPVDAVRLLAASGHHPAVLMLPACIALSTVRS